jgi:hypothetical protein
VTEFSWAVAPMGGLLVPSDALMTVGRYGFLTTSV